MSRRTKAQIKAEINEAIRNMEDELTILKDNAAAFLSDKGNNAAGSRVRGRAMNIKQHSSNIRRLVSEYKKAE